MLKNIFFVLPNATTAPFWKRSTGVLRRSGLFEKGYESVLDILGACSASSCVRTLYCGCPGRRVPHEWTPILPAHFVVLYRRVLVTGSSWPPLIPHPQHNPYSRLDKRKCSFSQRTITDWNNVSHDCVNASSVNMFKTKIDNYLARAGYT